MVKNKLYLDSAARIAALDTRIAQAKETLYNEAVTTGEGGEYDQAIATFVRLGKYSDSKQRADYYELRKEEITINDSDPDAIVALAARYENMGNYLDAQTRAADLTARADGIVADKYSAIMADITAGNLAKAEFALDTFGRYGNEKVKEHYYLLGEAYRNDAYFNKAVVMFRTAVDYSDAETQIWATYYAKGEALRVAGDYEGAEKAFKNAGNYEDAQTRMPAYYYTVGEANLADGDYDGAIAAFAKAGNYSDSKAQIVEAYYRKACALMQAGEREGATALLTGLNGYKDSATLILQMQADVLFENGCYADAYVVYAMLEAGYQTHAADYAAMYTAAEDARTTGDYDNAREQFLALGTYSDAAERAHQCNVDKADALFDSQKYVDAAIAYALVNDTEKRNESIYRHAGQLATQGEYLQAAKKYWYIKDYADSEEQHYQMGVQALAGGQLTDACEIFAVNMDYSDARENIYQIGVISSAEKQYDIAVSAFALLGAYDDAGMKRIMNTYVWGGHLYDNADYSRSAEVFASMGDFSNAPDRAAQAGYAAAALLMEAGEYADAKAWFVALGDYLDSQTQAKECDYRQAGVLYAEGQYQAVLSILDNKAMAGYKDVNQLITDCRYNIGVAEMNEGEYNNAVTYFNAVSGYKDAAAKAKECRLQMGLALMASGRYESAYKQFKLAQNTAEMEAAAYHVAMEKLSFNQYDDAISWFEKSNGHQDAKERIFSIGEFYHTTQQYELAEITYSKVADIDVAPQRIYEIGRYYESKGDYAHAARLYLDAGTYADAPDRAKEATYQYAEQLYQAGDMYEAHAEYRKIPGYKDADTKAILFDERFEVGRYLTFGTYPQTAKGNDDTPIEWLILARDGTKALLISRYALDCQPYHTSRTDIIWEECSLRSWLNDDFLNKAFSNEEQAAILTTNVTADKNPSYSTNPGNDTQDKVFLLSITEAEKYFKNDASRQCQPTAYAVQQGAYQTTNSSTKGNCWWWLRSPGGSQRRAADMLGDGSVRRTGDDVRSDHRAVRPAIWVDLDSGIF